jgi:hypothetical protein
MQSEISDVALGFSPEFLSSLGHDEEIESQVSEILLQDFNNFQNFTLDQEKDGLFQYESMEEVMGDTFYPSAKPSDITGQSLALTMEDDKNKVLSAIATPTSNKAATFENKTDAVNDQLVFAQPMFEQSNGQGGMGETQEVIDEMQEFLDQYDDGENSEEVNDLVDELLSAGQKATLESMDLTECPLANSTFIEDPETVAAENMIDQLLEQQSVSTNNDTGYTSATQSFDVSNVSQFVTQDGQDIIIVVAPEETQQPMEMPTTSTINNTVLSSILPSTSEVSNKKGGFDTERFTEVIDEDSNSSGDEWLPEMEVTNRRDQFKKPNTPPKNNQGRKLKDRTKLTAPARSSCKMSKQQVITDRKERKKWQNVEAARRYRDKKKAQEQQQGTEEQVLRKKNEQLKGELSGIESELTTIKKLMTELGLIKLVTPRSLKIN